MFSKESRQRAPLLWLWLVAILGAGAAGTWIRAQIKAVRPPAVGSLFLPIGSPGPHEQIVTRGHRPVASPDGRLYFTRDMGWQSGTGQLYSCMVDGTGENRIKLTPPGRYAFLEGKMGFSTKPPRCFLDYCIMGVAEYFGMGVLEAPDRLRFLVRDIPAALAHWAFVSRDCLLCFHLARGPGHDSNWVLSSLDSTGAVGPPLWHADPAIDTVYFYGDWAPDSSRFAFSDTGSRGRFMGDRGSPLYVLDVKRRIVTDKYLAPGVVIRGVAWSPDGRWIAFHVDHGSPTNTPMFSAVCALDLSSGRAWRLAECEGCPHWTPDMAYLVYERDGYIFRLDWRAALADKAQEVPMKHTRLDVGPQPPAKAEKGTGTR